MAALAVVMMGVGVFMVYEAVKSPTPTPLVKAKAAVGIAPKGG